MILHFDRKMVKRLVEHSKAAPKHRTLYGVATTDAPGLWLVGDQGVYLMSNGEPGLMKPGGKGHVVCYANECNPGKLAFDEWWAAKRSSFGGDDGCEFLPATDLEKMLATQKRTVALDVTPTAIGCLV